MREKFSDGFSDKVRPENGKFTRVSIFVVESIFPESLVLKAEAENVRRHGNGQILEAILFLTTVDTVVTIVSAENFRSEMFLQRVFQILFPSGRYRKTDVICCC